MVRYHQFAIALSAIAAIAVPAIAGEITGNGKPVEINSRSVCAYSGLNDFDGDPRDPGGRTQTFGGLVGQYDIYEPQDLDPNAPFFQPIPGWSCNPNRGADLNG